MPSEARCTLGVVLLREGIAEQRHDAVAELLGDMAAHFLDRRRGRVEIAADEIAPVLGVELGGNARGADEVAEHHGEVAALRGVLRRWGSGLRRLGRWILLGRLARGKLPDRPP